MVAVLKYFTYTLYTSSENEIAMVRAIKEMGIKGIMWPNREDPRFDLELTDADMIVLKLKVPFTIGISA
jgi:hypothetical protein